ERLAAAGRRDEGRELLDMLMTNVPLDVVRADEQSLILIAHAYHAVGEQAKVVARVQRAAPMVLPRLERLERSPDGGRLAVQFASMVRQTYREAQDFEAASAFLGRIADVLGDDSYRTTPEEMRRDYQAYLESLVPQQPNLPERQAPVQPPSSPDTSNS